MSSAGGVRWRVFQQRLFGTIRDVVSFLSFRRYKPDKGWKTDGNWSNPASNPIGDIRAARYRDCDGCLRCRVLIDPDVD